MISFYMSFIVQLYVWQHDITYVHIFIFYDLWWDDNKLAPSAIIIDT